MQDVCPSQDDPSGLSSGIHACAKLKADRSPLTHGFCVFIDTICEERVPSLRGENGKPCVFAMRVEAEREIADLMMTRLIEFMDGERDFDDAMTVEEYVLEVDVLPDGAVIAEDGSTFS